MSMCPEKAISFYGKNERKENARHLRFFLAEKARTFKQRKTVVGHKKTQQQYINLI